MHRLIKYLTGEEAEIQGSILDDMGLEAYAEDIDHDQGESVDKVEGIVEGEYTLIQSSQRLEIWRHEPRFSMWV